MIKFARRAGRKQDGGRALLWKTWKFGRELVRSSCRKTGRKRERDRDIKSVTNGASRNTGKTRLSTTSRSWWYAGKRQTRLDFELPAAISSCLRSPTNTHPATLCWALYYACRLSLRYPPSKVQQPASWQTNLQRDEGTVIWLLLRRWRLEVAYPKGMQLYTLC